MVFLLILRHLPILFLAKPHRVEVNSKPKTLTYAGIVCKEQRKEDAAKSDGFKCDLVFNEPEQNPNPLKVINTKPRNKT